MKIGECIRHLRQQNFVTQESLAQHLGVSCQSVSKWEVGRNTPMIEYIPKIATYFNVTTDELFGIEKYSNLPFPDDQTIRVVQCIGRKIIKINELSVGKPIPLIFPENNGTQLKIEIYGSITAISNINGSIVCNGDIDVGANCNGDIVNAVRVVCTNINGDIKKTDSVTSDIINGDLRDCNLIKAREVNAFSIISCEKIECSGMIKTNKLESNSDITC